MMSKENNGGPAFPQTQTLDVENPNGFVSGSDVGEGGMTLRDYFAAKSLPSVIKFWASSCEGFDLLDVQDCIAAEAYAMADAMLKERDA